MRIWFKEWESNHLLRDIVITDDSQDTRTHKVFHALEKACMELDLPVPIWLDMNIRDFQRHAKTRFTGDSFIEPVDFDALEILVLEED